MPHDDQTINETTCSTNNSSTGGVNSVIEIPVQPTVHQLMAAANWHFDELSSAGMTTESIEEAAEGATEDDVTDLSAFDETVDDEFENDELDADGQEELSEIQSPRP